MITIEYMFEGEQKQAEYGYWFIWGKRSDDQEILSLGSRRPERRQLK